eukprot:7669586-Alexandrium_andersonii.AAC.1
MAGIRAPPRPPLSALVLRGFEPSRAASTSWGNADILSQRVPGFVESVLDSRHAEERGFGFEERAAPRR